jgi:hypothetical protein
VGVAVNERSDEDGGRRILESEEGADDGQEAAEEQFVK